MFDIVLLALGLGFFAAVGGSTPTPATGSRRLQ